MKDELEKIVEIMEANGLIFSGKKFNVSTPYAILNGKTGIGYREKDKDGLSGIMLYCARDNADRDRFVSKLGKEYYDNSSDKTRPFKIVINNDEILKAIDILKMNEANIK